MTTNIAHIPYYFFLGLILSSFPASSELPEAYSVSAAGSKKALEFHKGYISVGEDTKYFYRALGDSNKPLIFFIHGYPESSLAWTKLMQSLAENYFTVAIDLKGFGNSTLSTNPSDYNIAKLTSDIPLLIDYFDPADVTVVGHDWGGALSWFTGIFHSTSIDRLVILNSPHPMLYYREYYGNPEAFEMADYVRRIRSGEYGVEFFREGNFNFFSSALWDNPVGLRGLFFSDEMKNAYREQWKTDAQILAPLNYYKSMDFPDNTDEGPFAPYNENAPLFDNFKTPENLPVLMLWGENDDYAVPEVNNGIERFVPNLKLVKYPENTHWIHHEIPDEVAKQISNFVSGKQN